MKKFLAIVAALFVAQSVFAQNKMSFTDGNVTGEIPAGWLVLFAGPDSTCTFYILSPEKDNDNFREIITVSPEVLPKDQEYTVEQYLAAVTVNLKEAYPTLKTAKSGKDWFICDFESEGIKIRMYARAFIKDGVAYLLFAQADSKDFKSVEKAFKEIIFSFN